MSQDRHREYPDASGAQFLSTFGNVYIVVAFFLSFGTPLTLKVELPYEREHDFHSSNKPQSDAFGGVILRPGLLTTLTLGSSCTSLGPLLHAFSSPSLPWQSAWEHFGASEAALAAPAAPFGVRIPPKVTSKWLSKAILTSLLNAFGDA